MYKINLKIFLILLIITLTGTFLRFYKLDKFPVQLNHDEISQIYDTASIVQTSKDIYGNFLPLAFPSTGEYKVGHYIYITVLAYLIFGIQEVTVRIPAAFFGSLTIPAVFFFIKQLTKNNKLALISALVVAINPSDIFYSRKSFENVIAIFFLFTALFLLLRQLEDYKNKISVFITALFLALPMYIYTSHTIVVPLILFVFSIIYWKTIKAFKVRFINLLVVWSILIIPLVYLTVTNPGLRFRALTVSIFQDSNLGNKLQLINTDNLISYSFLKIQTIIDFSFTKYLKQFNFGRLFANGLDLTNQSIVGMGPLLLLQFPFFLLGIVFILRSPFYQNNGKFLLLLMLLAILPSGITFEEYSPHRSVWGFSLISIISGFGFFWTTQFLKNRFNNIFKPVIGLFIILLGLNFIYFIHLYAINYPYEKSQNIHYPYKEVALFAWSQYQNFDQIIIDPKYGEVAPVKAVAAHYYLAYYGNYQPFRFQQDLKIDKIGMQFNKFTIREIDWRKDGLLHNSLVIASPWSVPIENIDKQKIIKRFNFYDGQPAFYAIKL